MIDFILLRIDAPLVSFGAPIVDNFGFVQRFPAKSMLTGLVCNALGYGHGDYEKIENIQDNLSYSVRCYKVGEELQDFQTVFLGQPHLMDTSWTTRGYIEKRKGGIAASKGTHIRYRDYRADSYYTVAMTMVDKDMSPSLGNIVSALLEPARPLFFGRKCCLPSNPIFIAVDTAENLFKAVCMGKDDIFKTGSFSTREPFEVWWPEGDEPPMETSRELVVTDERDWKNQVHCGRRFMYYDVIKSEDYDE